MIPKKLDNTISTISYSFFSTSCNFGQTQMVPWRATTVSICGKYWDRKSNPEEQDTCDKREATTLLKNCHSWEELVQALSCFSCTVILSATLDSALCQEAQLALNFRRWPWRIMACRVISWFQNISKYFHRYFGFIRFTEFVARADPPRGDSNWSSDIQMCEGDNQQVIPFSFDLSKQGANPCISGQRNSMPGNCPSVKACLFLDAMQESASCWQLNMLKWHQYLQYCPLDTSWYLQTWRKYEGNRNSVKIPDDFKKFSWATGCAHALPSQFTWWKQNHWKLHTNTFSIHWHISSTSYRTIKGNYCKAANQKTGKSMARKSCLNTGLA